MEQLDGVKKIADLYSANGTLPVYEITYAEKRIAFYLSRVGAPACAAGLEEIHADTRSVRILEQCLKQCGLPYVIGKTWTTDAIYRETHRVLEARKRQGCLAVEMECAAAYAVAQFRKIPILQFLYGADSLDSDTWEPRDLAEYGIANCNKYVALAFECARCL